MRAWPFLAAAIVVAAIVFALARYLDNDYVFFAGYVVLQFIVLATAWNILGGYCGYVNFGSAAFSAPILPCSSTRPIRCRSRC